MLKQPKSILALTLSILMIAWMAGESGAFSFGKKEEPKKKQGSSFSTAGHFTGSIEGKLVVGGREVVVTDDTSIFISGEGKSYEGVFVSNASVYVGGVVKRGVARASFVIVRPDNSWKSMKHHSFKESRHWVRSSSNSKIVMSTKDYQE